LTTDHAVPKSIIEALLKVRKNVPALPKDTVNPHARYKYAPIDAYYRTIKPIATDAGLAWRAREVGYEFLADVNRYRGSYVFDLFCLDGNVAYGYMSVTIVGNNQGAQTTGQLFSYAEKVFMRAAFGVETGEEDADAQDNTKNDGPPPRPKPAYTEDAIKAMSRIRQDAAETVGQILEATAPKLTSTLDGSGNPIITTKGVTEDSTDLLYQTLRTWIDKPTTVVKLRDYWAVNTPAIEKLKEFSHEKYELLLAEFKQQSNKLSKEKVA
jgi:ERF superfamily